MSILNKKLVAVAAVSVMGISAGFAQQGVDAGLPDYSRISGVSGNLNSIGSDTLNNLMALWAEGYRKKYPNVNIQIEGKGSSTAPPALMEGTSQLGPMSRKMKSSELEAFEAKHGFQPTAIGVALDSLAVYVHKDNPIKSMSLVQVDGAFSKTLIGGGTDVKTWGDIGVSGAMGNSPISLYGRNSASGTYGYFKSVACFKGDYKDSVKEQPGSAAVVNGITNDRSGLGYSGIGYRTSGVRAIPLSKTDADQVFEPNYENVLSGAYPLGRMLYVYVAKKPHEPLPPVVAQFLTYVLSEEGQEIVVKDGYLPLTADLAKAQAGKL